MAAYSSDLRERVFQAYQSGLSSPQVAERFGVSAPFVRKLALLHRRYGTIERRPCTQGRKPVLNDKQRDRLIELAWSQAKSWLRKKSPPTFTRLVRSIGDALRCVTPEHSRNYFRNSGYPVTLQSNPL